MRSHKASLLNLDRADHTPVSVAFELLPVVVTGPVRDLNRGALLPPPDLVITLGVRLI